MLLHDHRPNWWKFSNNVEKSPSRQCSNQWTKRCTKHQLFVPLLVQVLRLVESMRKPNLIDHRINSKVQCCSKARRHSIPSTELFCNTSKPFQVDSCRNSGQQCNSKLRCLSGRVELFACTSSPTMANCPSTQELFLVASTAICHLEVSPALCCKPQARLEADRSDSKLELFEEKCWSVSLKHKTIIFTEQKNRIRMGQKFYRQLQEILRQAWIPNCNQAST